MTGLVRTNANLFRVMLKQLIMSYNLGFNLHVIDVGFNKFKTIFKSVIIYL